MSPAAAPAVSARRLWQVGGLVGLAAAVLTVTSSAFAAAGSGAAPAAAPADSAPVSVSIPVVAASWYSRLQPEPILVLAPPAKVPDPTVPADGSLAVAGPDDTSAQPRPLKETYLGFDLSGVPAGAQITAFTVTLPVASASQGLVALRAVGAVTTVPDGVFNERLSRAPFEDVALDRAVALSSSATPAPGVYTLSSLALGQRLVQGDALGIGIRTGPAVNGQVVFPPKGAIRAQLTYTTAGDVLVGDPPPPPPPPSADPTASAPSTDSADSPTSQAPATSPAATPSAAASSEAAPLPLPPPADAVPPVAAPLPPIAFPAPVLPPAPLPVAVAGPAPGEAPALAEPAPAANPVAPVARARPVAVNRPLGAEGFPLSLAVALLALLGLLAVVATTLTMPAVARPAGRGAGGVSSALRSRRPGGLGPSS